ncbi:HigA family addiction module antitoxin [Qipengyuania sp.]|uniref:HigA family addiction module antitoxin n=1 Tax=Qipengyuania sp. TaxID=2004515 RepID=UPI0035C848BF
MAIKLHRSIHVHPGPWLRRNVLDPYRMSVTATANHLGVSRPPLNNLLNGKASLSPEMAVRFEKAFGISAATMLRMQSAYDLALAEEKAQAFDIARLPEPA